MHLQRGEPDKAIPALDRALKWAPDFIQAKNAMATALYMKEQYAEAEKLCREVIKQEPGFAPAWNNLALALFDQNRQKEAVEACDKAVELGFEVAPGFLEELAPFRA